MAGIGLFSSCNLLPEKKSTLTMDYVGTASGYSFYQNHLSHHKKLKSIPRTFQQAVKSSSPIVLIDENLTLKASYIVMLLEQDKDILATYPIGLNLGEYASISEFMEQTGRFVGLINPLAFYPSVEMLKEIIDGDNISLNKVHINCNPKNLGVDMKIDGFTGTAQPLQRIVSYITGTSPISLQANANKNGEPVSILIDFDSFETIIHFNSKHPGWDMEVSGTDRTTGIEFSANTDYTGMLAIQNEVNPRISSDPDVLEKSIMANIEDFLDAVRNRNEPRVNHLDGLASIMLNRAVEKSLSKDAQVSL